MNFKVLFACFVMVFLAELGDKTQLTALAFSSSSRSPWSVFVGTSLALICTTALAVMFGGLLARYVPEKILLIASAVMFVVIGLILLVNVARRAPDKAAAGAATPAATALPAPQSLVFSLILSQAVRFEQDAGRLFTGLAAAASEGQVRQLLLTIAAEEGAHAASVAALAQDHGLEQAGAGIDAELSAAAAQPLVNHALAPPSLTAVRDAPAADRTPAGSPGLDLAVLRQAIQAKEEAAEFYLALARLSSLHPARDAFRWLAMEEIRHSQALCTLANHETATT